MEIPQVVELLDVIGALAFDRCVRNREQLVGGLPHRGDDHHGTLGFARADDAGDALNCSGGLDRGPAELHDNHQSSIPSECISSAFSTAAPAAPRIVL